jgi:hypothetical protein
MSLLPDYFNSKKSTGTSSGQSIIIYMKQTISILVLSILLFSCGSNNQQKAVEQAKEIRSSIKPGTIATSASGYSMSARIAGREWIANSMMPPDASGRIIGYWNDEYIGLPYSKSNLTTGNKINFSEDDATDLSVSDDVGMYAGRKGEMEITKVDDKWIEGKFSFTGSSSSSAKIVEVTDGFFRIPVRNN